MEILFIVFLCAGVYLWRKRRKKAVGKLTFEAARDEVQRIMYQMFQLLVQMAEMAETGEHSVLFKSMTIEFSKRMLAIKRCPDDLILVYWSGFSSSLLLRDALKGRMEFAVLSDKYYERIKPPLLFMYRLLGRKITPEEEKKAQLFIDGVNIGDKPSGQNASPSIADNPNEGVFQMADFPYSSYEEWLSAYKAAAAQINNTWKMQEAQNGKQWSLIDLMDDTPLRHAYKNRLNPIPLGEHFGRTVNIRDIGF